MALLYIDSFDHYQQADITAKWTSRFPNVYLSVGGGRCGSNGLRFDLFDTLIRGIPFGSTRGTVGFAFFIASGATTAGTSISFHSVGNISATHLTLQANGDGSLQVFNAAGSVGLTSPGLIHHDHWYFIEWQMVIHGSTGAVTVRLNNTPVLTVTGINTVAASGLTELRHIRFHCGSDAGWRMDDLYVLDDTGDLPALTTFLGDCKVEYLRPRAPAAQQDWTPVGDPDHWQVVDDHQTPDGDTTYVESVTPGDTDTNLYEPTGLPSGSIFGAQLSLYARKAAIGPRVISPVVNDVVGSPHVYLSADSYQYHSSIHALNPTTGLPWTIAEINAASFGVTVAS